MKNLPGSRRHVAFNSLTAIGADAIDLQARLAPTRARLTARLALRPHALPRAARQGLWSTLDTPPVYNQGTIHTDLTCPAWGEYRTYKRHGPLGVSPR